MGSEVFLRGWKRIKNDARTESLHGDNVVMARSGERNGFRRTILFSRARRTCSSLPFDPLACRPPRTTCDNFRVVLPLTRYSSQRPRDRCRAKPTRRRAHSRPTVDSGVVVTGVCHDAITPALEVYGRDGYLRDHRHRS